VAEERAGLNGDLQAAYADRDQAVRDCDMAQTRVLDLTLVDSGRLFEEIRNRLSTTASPEPLVST
jgi:hypothetical protein